MSDSVDVPILNSERLVLRGHTAADFEPLAKMWADPKVMAYISGSPSTRDASWMRLLRYRGLWPILGFGYWAVTDRDTGAYLGDAGFADFQRDMTPRLSGPEAGWVLRTKTHGKGFATEAARTMLAWADRALTQTQICAITQPDHEASINVAQKCGFERTRISEFSGQPVQVLTRLRPG